MKIAIFGGSGQVATELKRRVPKDVTLETIDRTRANFENALEVFEVARGLEADAAINAVAYTAVDRAEEEPELADAINNFALSSLVHGCVEADVPLVHLSTDYVFPGTGSAPWSPHDEPNPLGVYGTTKRLGEKAFESRSRFPGVVLRTSWVFSAHGGNFVKTMLKYGAERDVMRVVNDQVGGPTPAADIADACYSIAAGLAGGADGGVHHFSGAPDVSWADFAREIFSSSGLSTQVEDIPSSEYPTPAERPKNSRLDCSSLTEAFGIERPEWRTGLQDVLKELGAT